MKNPAYPMELFNFARRYACMLLRVGSERIILS